MSLLIFSPHPDDAEIFCGGLISKSNNVSVIDFCRGELGSQGTVESRAKEINAATKVLNLLARDNLELPDGFSSLDLKESWIDKIVTSIRKIKPKMVVCPYWESRHPDHAVAGKLVQKSIFFAGLKKFKPELGQAHKVVTEAYYPMRVDAQASFVCDVTEAYDKKLEAINCYQSQIKRSESNSLISSPLTIHSIKARDSFFGAQIGVAYGEPYILRHAIKIDDPVNYFDYLDLSPALLYWR